jgi:hypothetical protein
MDGVWCVVGWEMVGRLLDCWKLGWGKTWTRVLSDASNTLCLGGVTKAWVATVGARRGRAWCASSRVNIVVVLFADKKEEMV